MAKLPYLLFEQAKKKFVNIPDVKSVPEQPPLFGHLPGQQVAFTFTRVTDVYNYIHKIKRIA